MLEGENFQSHIRNEPEISSYFEGKAQIKRYHDCVLCRINAYSRKLLRNQH